jgi:hypothetical protein
LDEDGRVRQSAKRGVRDVFGTYDTLEDEATIAALIEERETMAEEYSGKQREHLLAVRDGAVFHLQSGLPASLKGL